MSALFNPTDHEFGNTFRLIDEIDRHFSRRHRFVHDFIPRFDLEETRDSYVLFGELPGALEKDLKILATDNHTLEVSGKTTREAAADQEPEKVEGHQNGNAVPQNEGESSQSAVTPQEQPKSAEVQISNPKRLLSERLVGEFHRSFSFPKPIDSTAVAATMNNGVLRIVVPKGPAPNETRVPVKYLGLAYAGF